MGVLGRKGFDDTRVVREHVLVKYHPNNENTAENNKMAFIITNDGDGTTNLKTLAIYQIMDDLIEVDDKNRQETPLPLMTIMGSIVSKEERPKVAGFGENVVTRMSNAEFRRHFRISRDVYMHLKDDLHHQLLKNYRGGYLPILPDKQLLIFLWYCANQDSQREIAVLFGVGEWAVNITLRRVSDLLCEHTTKYISWPNVEREIEIAESFEDMSGIGNIVGALDGTHIPIVNCPGGDNDYINCKGFPSVQLQLIVDDRLLINDAYVGWPGSTHDARVLRNSSFYEEAEAGRNIAPGKLVIGDGAYPLRNWLITPYRDTGHLTPPQKKFNKALSSARQCVERANAHLKGRFRRLQKVYCKDVEDICKLTMSCCVLHNLCIICADEIDEFIDINLVQNVNNYMNNFQNLQSGENVRAQITANL